MDVGLDGIDPACLGPGSVLCDPAFPLTPAAKVRSTQTFFTHRSVSTFDRSPFQLTGVLFLYGMAPQIRAEIFVLADVRVPILAGTTVGLHFNGARCEASVSSLVSSLDATTGETVKVRAASCDLFSPVPRFQRLIAPPFD